MKTWEASAACVDWPPELFMVTVRGNPHPGVAESLCADCPVRVECLADGWWDEYAVRGGMTPAQRAALVVLLRPVELVAEALPSAVATG